MPALALADALRTLRPDVDPVMVGAQRGIEASILPEREPHYRFHLLDVGPVYRRQWWRNAGWVVRGPRLALTCRRLVAEEKPVLAVGTGGYAAGPVLYAAFRAGVPIALQEQNAYPGLTTRILARWATEIYSAFEEAVDHLPKKRGKVIIAGNPIAPPTAVPVGATTPKVPDDTPAFLVMGGSQGARAINEAVSAALDDGLLENVALLWSTGHTTYEQYRRHHDPPLRQVRAFWNPIASAYQSVQLVVARAGAMTIAELRAWGLPSILVPLPTSAEGHQAANANALEEAGAAMHLPESELTPDVLARQVGRILQDASVRARMEKAARAGATPNAAADIAGRLAALLDGQSLS